VGIDSIKVRGPLTQRPDFSKFRGVNRLSLPEGSGAYEASAWTIVDSVHLGVNSASNIGPCGHWEASLPTVRYGHNLRTLPFTEAFGVLQQTYQAAQSLLEWKVPIEEFSVSRLDTTTDFHGIDDISEVLRALSHLPIPGKAGRWIWDHATGVNGISIQVPGRWKAQFYDKRLELIRRRPKVDERVIEDALGILRFEVKTLWPVNKGKPFSTVGGLSQEAIEAHNWAYFAACGFDQEIGGYSKIADAMRASINASNTAQFASMLGYMHFINGFGRGPFGEFTDRKYKKLLKANDLSPADLFGAADTKLRLDHHSGLLEVKRYGSDLEMAA
jgi:hypothetical protein